MSSKDVITSLMGLLKNPYGEFYDNMAEHELNSWKSVFEASIALGRPNREKIMRLSAIDQALKSRNRPTFHRAA
jgi:hypothetical protein